ncbi:MAG: molybdopterin-dependent oxidoreductase, partial [Methanotrichaceae archaeon]|nr:molybdopterin-dependent oxidoreductase [Methanotrichaceae archaeon]
MTKILTTCIYCGCGCGLFLHVEDGRVVGTSPSPGHPMSLGRLCIKGWLAHEFIGHPDRLRHPLIKEMERFRKARWEEAATLIHKRFSEIRDSAGPDSLAVLTSAKATNEENYLLMKLARAGLFTNNIDHVARLCHAPTLAGLGAALGSGSMTNNIRSLIYSDLILVTGSNTTEQHPLVAATIIEAKARGARLVVVDPRRTQIADLSDMHLMQKPGSDVAWINCLLHTIIKEGLLDQEFISTRTEGFEEVKKTVDRYTPQVVEQISGIKAEDLRSLAVAFGTAKRASIVYAMGITQHTS